MKVSRKSLNRLAIGAVLGVVLWLLSSYTVAYYLTRRAHALCDEPVPALTWSEVQALRLSTPDGEEIGAWFIDGRLEQPVILLLHGNGDCRSACLSQAELAASAGCAVLMISLRAHGDSTGDFNDMGYSARQDVVAAVAWLENNRPHRPIVVWGQSLGSAAAVFAAGKLGGRVHGYILECPYKDLRTAVWNRTKVYLPPVLDVIAYTGLLTVSPLVLREVDLISPLEAISEVPSSVPVLILAGSADRRATPEEARALAERIQSHARLVMIEGGDHAQLPSADPAAYRAAVMEFVANCQSVGPPALPHPRPDP